MNISLTEKQQNWLNTHIANGEFASIDDAVQQLIEFRMMEETDDLAWAKPLVDEALSEAERSQGLSFEEYKMDMAQHMGKLRGDGSV